MGKIKVSNGTETYEIDGNDLQSAVKDGYKPTERIIVANSKTKESYEIDPNDVESALKDGFSFSDIVKKNAASVEQSQPLPPPQKDLLTLAKERKNLQGIISELNSPYTTATPGGFVQKPNDEAYKTDLNKVNEAIKAQGGDDQFADDIADIPTGEGFSFVKSIPDLIKMRDENKYAYNRELSAIKSKGDLFNAIRNKTDVKTAGQLIQGLQATEGHNYRTATKEAIDLARKYVDDGDEQQKIIKNFASNKAYEYGLQPLVQDERFANMNPYQQRAMQFLEDVDPATFQSYQRLLSFNPDEQWSGSNEADIRRGFETKSKELEDIGMNLQMKAYEEKLTNLKNKAASGSPLTPKETSEYDQLMSEYQTLSKDKENQSQRYPSVAAMDADRLMQESMGSKNSIGKKFLLGVGENFDDAVNWVGDLVQDKGVAGDLELLGDKEASGLNRYATEGDRLIGSEFIASFDDGLQKQINDIKSSNISDEQKQDKVRQLIFNNQDKVHYIPNDKSGKYNFTAKAVLNTVSDVASDLVSQLALAYATGGSGDASKIKQLGSLFGSTFATAYDDYYNEAIKNNVAKPSEYAITHTAIEAASELINNDFEVAKKLVGKTGTLGKVLNKVSKEEWEAIAKKGFFGKFKDAALQTGKTALGNAIEETKEEVAGQLAGNIADQKIFNKETGLGEGVKDTMIQTMVGMLPLGLLSLPFNYQNINRNQKYAMYEAGMNPNKFIQAIDKGLSEGLITTQQAEEQKANVQRAAQAVKSSTAIRTDGTPMTDNEKTEYAFNQSVLQEIKEQKRDAPPDVKEKLEKEEQKINTEQAELVKPKKAKQTYEQKIINKAIKEGKIPDTFANEAKKNPSEFFKTIADQINGLNSDGSQSILPDAEKAVRDQYGDAIVDKAKELYPLTIKSQPNASTVRSNQRQATEGGQVNEAGQNIGSENIQPSSEQESVTTQVDEQTRSPEIVIETPEDFENELSKIFSNEEKTETQPQEIQQKTESKKTDTSKEKKIGQSVDAYFAGGKVSGTITEELSDGRFKIKDANGNVYRVKPKDIILGNETASEHYERTKGIPSLFPKEDGKIPSVSNNSSVKDVLEHVYKNKNKFSELANDILKNSDLKSLNVKVFSEENTEDKAIYKPDTDSIELSGLNATNPQAILHEIIHATTAKKIPRIPFDVHGKDYLNDLNKYKRNERSEVDTLIDLYLEAAKKLNQYDRLFKENGEANDYKSSHSWIADPDMYGMTNLDEFLAETFTNKNFQEKLKKISYSQNETLWDRFINIVKKLLGLKVKNNILDQALSVGREIIHSDRNALPKLGEINQSNNSRSIDEDITQYTTQNIIEKSKDFYKNDPQINRVVNLLEPIIAANPNIKIDTDFKWDSSEYEGSKITNDALGYSFPSGNMILNFDKISDYDTLYRAALHEMVHAVTRNEINTNSAFNEDLKRVLSDVRKAMKIPDGDSLVDALMRNKIISEDYDNRYGAANEHEMLAEVFTNDKFFNFLKGLEYKGDNLLHRLYLAIAKFFSEKYKQLVGAKESISADNMADYLMALTESVIKGNQEQDQQGGALPLRPSEREVLKNVIAKATGKISEADIRGKLKQIAGLTDEEIDELMSEVSPPSTPLQPSKTLSQTEIGATPSEPKRKSKLRKFKERYFERAQGLPDWILKLKDKAKGSVHLEVRQALQVVDETKKVAKKIGFDDWTLFDKALREQYYGSDLEALKSLPPEMQVQAVQMRNKIDSLSRDLIINNYVTPEQALNIESNIGEYVTRSYRAFNEKNWGKKVPQKAKDDAYRLLVQEIFNEKINERAEDLNNGNITEDELIQESKIEAFRELQSIIDGISDRYTPTKTNVQKGKDLGILKQRKDIPKEIRELLGEYTDPGVNFAITVARIAQLKSQSEYLNSVKNEGLGEIFFNADDRPPGASVQIASDGSETWNPLNGLYTTPEVKEVFKEAENNRNWLVRNWLRGVGAIKWGKTVGSVVTQVKNFESNLGFALMNGHFNAGKSGESFKFLKDKLFTGEKSKDALIEKVIRLGLVDQSVGVRELKNMFETDSLDKVILNSTIKSTSPLKKIGRGAGKVVDYLNKVYGASDDFWKVYGFLNEAESLSQAQYGKSYKNLTQDEQSSVDTEASERVKNTYPTYDRVWEGAKYVSKNLPIFGNFLSFQAESIRVLLNTFDYAIKDLKTPGRKMMGAKRMAGIGAYMGARSMILYTIAQMTGVGMAGLLGLGNDDDEDQKLNDINRYSPDFIRSGDKLAIDKGDGNYTVYDMGGLEPYGIWFKTMNAYTEGNDLVKNGGIGAAATELLSPFFEPEMSFKIGLNLYNNENDFGSRIYNPTDGFGDQMLDVMAFIAKKAEPSTIDFVQRLYSREDKQAELSAMFGGRPYQVETVKSFSFKLKAAEELFDANRDALNKVKYSPKSTEEDIKAAELKFEERTNKIIRTLSEDYKAAIRLGAKVGSLDEVIDRKKFFQGYNKDVKNKIKSGVVEEEKASDEIKEWQP